MSEPGAQEPLDEPVEGEQPAAEEAPAGEGGLPGVEFFWGVNFFDVETEGDEKDPEGYKARAAKIGERIRGEAMGATVYDLDPGQSVCPYHYELGEEEWLLVLNGTPTLRDENDDEFELKPWDLLFFADGEEGAHKVTNKTEEPVRIVMLSTKSSPAIAFYPDSGKVGIFPPGKLFRLDSEVDYWDGEV
ncbi:MAG TPA: cupin domain-containing protein [Gaiellaceae bacterium]|jgi:uncharacterized cupin superfamily protein